MDQIHGLSSVQSYKPFGYLKKDSNFNRIIMNTLALIILSLTAIATAAPGGWRCGRSPGWCKNKG